jgi:hypothetical protein
MGIATIHWDMQMTLLSLSAENFQTPSQSFYRRLSVWYNSGVKGHSCLSIHKRW